MDEVLINFYRVSLEGNVTVFIEANGPGVAAAVYASKYREHPYSVRCSCCGPIGWIIRVFESEVLEAIEDGVTIIFDAEYTTADLINGERYYHHVNE